MLWFSGSERKRARHAVVVGLFDGMNECVMGVRARDLPGVGGMKQDTIGIGNGDPNDDVSE